MGIDDDISKAIFESHPSDLPIIRKYIQWVKIRRLIHHRFYFMAHWMKSTKKYHWVGR